MQLITTYNFNHVTIILRTSDGYGWMEGEYSVIVEIRRTFHQD